MDVRLPLERNGAAPEQIRARAGLMTEGELADALGVNITTLALWRKEDQAPPHIKIGRSIFYLDNMVKAWVELLQDQWAKEWVSEHKEAVAKLCEEASQQESQASHEDPTTNHSESASAASPLPQAA